MSILKKIGSFIFVLIILLSNQNLLVSASNTPIFDSLTPNLQNILRKFGEDQQCPNDKETPEELAEKYKLNYKIICIDGKYACTREGGKYCRPKLTNEDIESLSNLPRVEHLSIRKFDLSEVDVTKFLDINNGKIQFLEFDDCKFSCYEAGTLFRREGYDILNIGRTWIISWPGFDIDDLFRNAH